MSRTRTMLAVVLLTLPTATITADAATPQQKLTLREARSAASVAGKQIGAVFFPGKERIRTVNRCRRLGLQNVTCQSVARGPGLYLRYRTYVTLRGDLKTLDIYWRDVEIVRQPNGPF